MKQNRNGMVKISWHGGDRFDVLIRHHMVRVDQPKDFGGSDTGPTPVELFIGSLAAGIAHCAERYLHRCQLPAGVSVTAHYGLGLHPAHVSHVDLVVEAPGVPEGLRESFANIVEHGTVHNSLRVPPEITFQIRIAEADPALKHAPQYP
ncbi:OsmC family protein [Planotetraspora sp. A-T 1434]|uniref:OsmC family protein n=1 Tax=Planotetraspora sp. A-T 1434 TaxID=2979219 RepID=UPI0021C050FF|nr:OsmC family protein [Planotetraspora sp. A-T 1434]MCT9933731.1 OsmC family protein [Planotetraspora sp. A-T 1434]